MSVPPSPLAISVDRWRAPSSLGMLIGMRFSSSAAVSILCSLRPAAGIALALPISLIGCGQPDGFFSDDIGVEAEPVAGGEHAGTFALRTTNTTQIVIPGIEPLEGGGENFRLVTRTYVPEDDHYEQRSELCGGFNYAVVGVVTEATQDTYRAVPPSEAERVRITADGIYTATDHIQLWALALPDPFGTALPDERAEVIDAEGQLIAPWDERITDMDGDGAPGFTLRVGSDIGAGEIYAVQRKTVALEGVVLGPDRVVGLAKNENETLTLGASNPAIDRDTEGSARPHPDPKKSFFEEVRLDDGATCADVDRAVADGLIGGDRPF